MMYFGSLTCPQIKIELNCIFQETLNARFYKPGTLNFLRSSVPPDWQIKILGRLIKWKSIIIEELKDTHAIGGGKVNLWGER